MRLGDTAKICGYLFVILFVCTCGEETNNAPIEKSSEKPGGLEAPRHQNTEETDPNRSVDGKDETTGETPNGTDDPPTDDATDPDPDAPEDPDDTTGIGLGSNQSLNPETTFGIAGLKIFEIAEQSADVCPVTPKVLSLDLSGTNRGALLGSATIIPDKSVVTIYQWPKNKRKLFVDDSGGETTELSNLRSALQSIPNLESEVGAFSADEVMCMGLKMASAGDRKFALLASSTRFLATLYGQDDVNAITATTFPRSLFFDYDNEAKLLSCHFPCEKCEDDKIHAQNHSIDGPGAGSCWYSLKAVYNQWFPIGLGTAEEPYTTPSTMKVAIPNLRNGHPDPADFDYVELQYAGNCTWKTTQETTGRWYSTKLHTPGLFNVETKIQYTVTLSTTGSGPGVTAQVTKTAVNAEQTGTQWGYPWIIEGQAFELATVGSTYKSYFSVGMVMGTYGNKWHWNYGFGPNFTHQGVVYSPPHASYQVGDLLLGTQDIITGGAYSQGYPNLHPNVPEEISFLGWDP